MNKNTKAFILITIGLILVLSIFGATLGAILMGKGAGMYLYE